MSHDDLDDEELAEEECPQMGLSRSRIVPDMVSHNVLLNERSFCQNQPFGCCDTPVWSKLQGHERDCRYTPVHCSNPGCADILAQRDIPEHLAICLYAKEPCSFCNQLTRHKDLEEHYGECESAHGQCTICNADFSNRQQLMVHQKTHVPCITENGNCYYYSYCKFESSTPADLREHLQEEKDLHIEALTARVYELEQAALKQKLLINVKKAVNSKVKPLERVAVLVARNVEQLKDREASLCSGDHLVNAMNAVSLGSQQIEQFTGTVAGVDKQIKDSGLDRAEVLEYRAERIRRNHKLLIDMEKQVQMIKSTSYDGTLLWRISEYRKKKASAVGGVQTSIWSNPFYTRRFGYKLCCRAYLNGDGEARRGKYQSLFIVIMRGECDALLTFPFQQQVTFSLLCPTDSSLHKHVLYQPDPDSDSFRMPLTEMNRASGCPNFALQSEVETNNYLVADNIYIRVKVEPGGDVIP